MISNRYKSGFTLIELLVALIVTSIVVTAVVTLSYALDTANDFTNDTSKIQAEIRFASLRISDLIRYCKLICGTPGGQLAVWQADDNGDGQININELVYIERGTDNNYLRLCKFNSSYTSVVSLSDIQTLSTSGYYVTYVSLIPQCSNVQFYLDDADTPPNSRFVSISYDVVENGVTRHCQINAELRSRAGNLLDESGNIVSDDD
jgi:prepilin-type N-terminal cleavage/methylation domain-containing protein